MSFGRAAVAGLLVCLLGAGGATCADARGAPASPQAPAAPPLTSAGAQAHQASEADEAGAGGSPQSETDPLVSNGLGSPLCIDFAAGGGLSRSSRRNCETSGFVATAAPTADFGIDVHIDTGLLGISSGGLLTVVQDLLVTPLWMALVWVVHALVVMLEWCFTVDLLDSTTLSAGVARGLRQLQASVTAPWLASVLAVGSVLCVYNGLIRRRVAESVGEALLALAMIATGTWLMLDPAGTLGAVGSWANQASLGTLAATARGAPGQADRALADSMGALFAAVIEAPWCYLEFGDVDWCQDPARLDPGLRAAAQALASEEASEKAGEALEHSARLLRAARTNGAIFLALPANGPARNAINDPSSLLRAICRNDEATSCRGPSAAPAEFRTNHGTWARVGGLLLIFAGVLGMLLLLGFLAVRLLGAAIFSLLYLLLAPAVALAPALGERGRAVFRQWLGRLLGAIVSKLLFSFLLGVILAIVGILERLPALGWWTQWLLLSAFWWGAFLRREQVLQLASGRFGDGRLDPGHATRHRTGGAHEARRRALGGVRAAKERFAKRSPGNVRAESSGSSRSSSIGGGQAASALARQHALPSSTSRQTLGDDGPAGSAASSGRDGVAGGAIPGLSVPTASTAAATSDLAERAPLLTERLALLAEQRSAASSAGNARRVAQLDARARRVEGDGEQRESRRFEGPERYGRFLDAQSALASAEVRPRVHATVSRSYPALAGLAGYAPREYKALDAAGQRAARVRIDRELALRKEQVALARPARSSRPSQRTGESLGQGAVVLRPPRRGRDGFGPGQKPASESSVMRDAREVAARRKRQLGHGWK